MSRDVYEPGSIRARGWEMALLEIVMDQWARVLGAVASPHDDRDEPVFPAPRGDPDATYLESVGQGQPDIDEPVYERQVGGAVGLRSCRPPTWWFVAPECFQKRRERPDSLGRGRRWQAKGELRMHPPVMFGVPGPSP